MYTISNVTQCVVCTWQHRLRVVGLFNLYIRISKGGQLLYKKYKSCLGQRDVWCCTLTN